MKIKIILPVVTLFIVSFTACKKNLSEGKEEISEENNIPAAIFNNVRNEMKNEIIPYDYDHLDWEHAVVKKHDKGGFSITVKKLHNTNDSLVYLASGDMKLYQWRGEVRVVLKK